MSAFIALNNEAIQCKSLDLSAATLHYSCTADNIVISHRLAEQADQARHCSATLCRPAHTRSTCMPSPETEGSVLTKLLYHCCDNAVGM